VAEILARCQALNLNAVTRASGDLITEAIQVLIIDDREEDGLWYRLASVTFLGQSLCNNGGSDPYPAATFGSAMLHGPHLGNFTNAYARFKAVKATLQARDSASLADAVTTALAADIAAEMAHAAWEVCSAGAEVTDRVTDLVHDILDLREEITA
jgi:3-deoxy-D-manno-octulosonic-acid transferase